jgi:aminoglycoside phosphotransferase (APT) family kinase protein
MVLRYIEGVALAAGDLAGPRILPAAVALLRRCRAILSSLYVGPWIDRSPAATLASYQSLIASRPNRWRSAAAGHQRAIAAVSAHFAAFPRTFVHGDVHAANIVDDGDRLWLVDWEYAGSGIGLVDLASLTVNGLFDEAATRQALALWHGAALGRDAVTDLRFARLAAALRDLFWGYAQDAFGGGFDGEPYVKENERRVEIAKRGVTIK